MILSETFDVEHGPDLVGKALVCFRSFFISLFLRVVDQADHTRLFSPS